MIIDKAASRRRRIPIGHGAARPETPSKATIRYEIRRIAVVRPRSPTDEHRSDAKPVQITPPDLAHNTAPNLQIPIDRATGTAIASPARSFLPC